MAGTSLKASAGGTGGRATADNGQPGATVLGNIEFGTLVKARPALKAGEGKGKKAAPLDEATVGMLNLMLEAGGGQDNSANWKGTQFELRQKLTGPMSSTFAKWAKAQEVRGVIVKLHRNVIDLAANGIPALTDKNGKEYPNEISTNAADNDKLVLVNYYISVEQADEKVEVKA